MVVHLDAPCEGMGHDVVNGSGNSLAGFTKNLHGSIIEQKIGATGEGELMGDIRSDLIIRKADKVVVVCNPLPEGIQFLLILDVG